MVGERTVTVHRGATKVVANERQGIFFTLPPFGGGDPSTMWAAGPHPTPGQLPTSTSFKYYKGPNGESQLKWYS